MRAILEDHPSSSTSPPVEPLLQLLVGFQASQVLMTSHRLGVFKALHGRREIPQEVCNRLELPWSSGERLLRACVALKLLDNDEGYFSNSRLAETYLVPSGDSYLGGLLDYYQDIYLANVRLGNAITQNRPQVMPKSEGPRTDIFSAMQQESALADRFLQAMHSLGIMEGERLSRLFPFEKISHMLDLGGGSGAIAMSLAEAYPHLRLTLFDRPMICQRARQFLQAKDFGDRIDVVPGDFWSDSLPPHVDAVLLSMILHDWDRSRGIALLSRCQEVLPHGGRIFIYEQILNEDRCGPAVTCLTNLTMLLRTASGSEYTFKEYTSMLEAVGFEEVNLYRSTGLRHLITAVKR
jgi:predicted O-methyltransferase YrrM